MTMDEVPSSARETRPAWSLIVFATIGGVVTGGVAFLILLWPMGPLLDLIFSKDEWQADVKLWPELFRFAVLVLFWAIPLTLGQWLSVAASGWSKVVYFAAVLQTFHIVTLHWDSEFAYLWALPALIALAFVWLGWAARAAESSRTRKAKYRSRRS